MTMQDVQGLLDRLRAEKAEASGRLARAIQDVDAAERVLALLEGDTEDYTDDTGDTVVEPYARDDRSSGRCPMPHTDRRRRENG